MRKNGDLVSRIKKLVMPTLTIRNNVSTKSFYRCYSISDKTKGLKREKGDSGTEQMGVQYTSTQVKYTYKSS